MQCEREGKAVGPKSDLEGMVVRERMEKISETVGGGLKLLANAHGLHLADSRRTSEQREEPRQSWTLRPAQPRLPSGDSSVGWRA